MTEKQKEEIQLIIAQAFSESIVGRVEQNVMNVLSPKLARMQTLQAEAERAAEYAKGQEAGFSQKAKDLEAGLPALQAKLAEARTKFDAEMATMQKAKDSFKSQLDILSQQVKEAEIANGKRVREVQEKADRIISEIETSVATARDVFDRERKAHEEFRKSIGL